MYEHIDKFGSPQVVNEMFLKSPVRIENIARFRSAAKVGI